MVAFVLGILFVVAFNMVLEHTNTEKFCIGCHEMKENYEEYRKSAHFSNRTGVRAKCVDCHLPKSFFPKILHKFKASNDIWHSMLGTIDTPEKFEERRPVLAQREWQRLKKNGSRECLDCHDPESFDSGTARQHKDKLLANSCIDCHKGIVHTLPTGFKADSKWPPVEGSPTAPPAEAPTEAPIE